MLTRFSDIDRTFAAMDHLRRRMDRLFDEYDGRRADGQPERTWSRGAGPRFALSDTGSALVVRADLPGFGDKDVQLSIHQEVLTITGERKADAPEGYYVHRQERPAMRFARSLNLPCKVDPEKSTATIKNGVLTVTLAKAAEAQPRQIAVKAQ